MKVVYEGIIKVRFEKEVSAPEIVLEAHEKRIKQDTTDALKEAIKEYLVDGASADIKAKAKVKIKKGF